MAYKHFFKTLIIYSIDSFPQLRKLPTFGPRKKLNFSHDYSFVDFSIPSNDTCLLNAVLTIMFEKKRMFFLTSLVYICTIKFSSHFARYLKIRQGA